MGQAASRTARHRRPLKVKSFRGSALITLASKQLWSLWHLSFRAWSGTGPEHLPRPAGPVACLNAL